MAHRPDLAPGSPAPGTPRIVILNDNAVADGGTAVLALKSARMLAARGYDVTFIAGDVGDDGALKAAGVRLIALGGRHLLDQSQRRAAQDGIYNRRLRDLIRAEITASDTPDTVYHLHGWAGVLSPSVFAALRDVASRTYIHAHDFFLACPNGVYFDFPRQMVCHRKPMSLSCLTTNCDKRAWHHKQWRSLRHAVLHRAFDTSLPWAGIVLISDAMAEGLARAGLPSRLFRTVLNPAEPFGPTRIPAERNRKLAFIGRLEAGKGVELLCAASHIADLPLRVIGDGAMRAQLEATFPEVEFAGWRQPDEIGAMLGEARALVLPTLTPEPFGLVAAEASCSGLPVLMSSAMLLSGELVDKGLGLAADVASPETLAGSLNEFMALPDTKVEEMSRRGFERRASIANSAEGWIDGLVATYRACLTG